MSTEPAKQERRKRRMAEATETKATATKTSEPAGPPVAESGPAIAAAHAVYPPGPGNWSDPPELAEDESDREGSLAAPLEEELADEREKIVKEYRERYGKALAENEKKAQARVEYDKKAAKA